MPGVFGAVKVASKEPVESLRAVVVATVVPSIVSTTVWPGRHPKPVAVTVPPTMTVDGMRTRPG